MLYHDSINILHLTFYDKHFSMPPCATKGFFSMYVCMYVFIYFSTGDLTLGQFTTESRKVSKCERLNQTLSLKR